jgi:hypothetical protein
MNQEQNDQLVLICGVSASGKSASLRNIRNQERWLFMNTEAGKRLPFKNKFRSARVDDPYQVLQAFDYAIEHKDEVDGIIIDSLTFLMDQYESKYVLTSSNTMKSWSDFQQYFKTLMQDKVIKFGKPVLMIAHTLKVLNESTGEFEVSVPIKGALKNNGIEAYFSTVVAAKKVPLKELLQYKNDLLHITEEDEAVGYKHVFQTRITKNTTGERIRSPMGLFSKEETYIDNDAQILLDHLNSFYNE